MTSFKKGAIVKAVGMPRLYEVNSQHGTKVLCREVNPDYTTVEYDSIFDISELELVLDEPNDAFNILFDDNND